MLVVSKVAVKVCMKDVLMVVWTVNVSVRKEVAWLELMMGRKKVVLSAELMDSSKVDVTVWRMATVLETMRVDPMADKTAGTRVEMSV